MTGSLRVALVLAAVSALALSSAACVSSTPPPGLIPTGPPVARIEALTGEYCYYGPDFNVRSFGRTVDGIPFIRVSDLGIPTLVSVQVTAERIVFRYTGADGTEKRQDFEVTAKDEWQGASLRLEWAGGTTFFPLPGAFDISGHSRESKIFKLADGRLVLTDSVRQKGYSETGSHSFSGSGFHSESQPVFHREERTVALILDPAIGGEGCDPNVEGRSRQPWFERGLDLRDPACAAVLEEQLTAIMVQKDEKPEAAAIAASDTVESFFHGKPSLAFVVSTRPDWRYYFKIVKKKSGCVLKLYFRDKTSGAIQIAYSSLASRPLPACACND